jgi:hypothetical protein
MFELLPFENVLVAFDLTGAQVLDLLRVVVSHRDAQSGARIKYRINSDKQPELESARLLIDGVDNKIDPAAIYTVISIDYLLNVTGGDYAAVLKQAKNTRPLGLTIRDAITNYVKAETAAGREIKSSIDGRFIFDKAASAAAEGQQPLTRGAPPSHLPAPAAPPPRLRVPRFDYFQRRCGRRLARRFWKLNRARR